MSSASYATSVPGSGGFFARRASPPFARPGIRQIATGTGASFSLSLEPLPGNILVAVHTSIAYNGTVTGIGGGGVSTWDGPDRQQYTGTFQEGFRLWWGVVGSTPCKAMLFTGLNASVIVIVELSGLRGIQDAQASAVVSTGAVTLSQLVSQYPGAIVLMGIGNRSAGSSPSIPVGFTTIVEANNGTNSRSKIAMLDGVYNGSPPLVLSTGSVGSTQIVSAIILR